MGPIKESPRHQEQGLGTSGERDGLGANPPSLAAVPAPEPGGGGAAAGAGPGPLLPRAG